MDNMWIICLPAIIILIIAVILIIYISSKKYLLGTFPNKELYSFRAETIKKFATQGFKIDDKGEKLHLESGALTATNLFFTQNGNQVEVYRQNSATAITWVLVVIGAFFFLIVALVVGLISDSNSKNFAEKTILPLIIGHHPGDRLCPSCRRAIPFDANICPYCSKKFENYL